MSWAKDTSTAIGRQISCSFEGRTREPSITAFDRDTIPESDIVSNDGPARPTTDFPERASKLLYPCTIVL